MLQYGIEVTFSDGAAEEHVFHAGDAMTVSWPGQGDAFLKGYKATIPLISPEGITYGTAEVGPSGAIIRFFDPVEDMYDVHGSFWLEAMAVNETDTQEEDTKTLSVTGGQKTAEVAIHKGASGAVAGGDTPDVRK